MSEANSKNSFSNINIFLNSLGLCPPEREELRDFSSLSLEEKNSLYGNSDNHYQYRIIRDNKTYYFDAFSSLAINESDKEAIRNKDYSFNDLIYKTLEIAGYPTLVDSKFIFAISRDELMFLVEFYKDGKRYIINLEYDLIMEKDMYYRYTKAQVLSTVDGETMDELDSFIELTDLEISKTLIDMFPHELLADFKKNEKVLKYNQEKNL